MTDIWDYYMDLARAGLDPEEVRWEEPNPDVLENLKQDFIVSFKEAIADIKREDE